MSTPAFGDLFRRVDDGALVVVVGQAVRSWNGGRDVFYVRQEASPVVLTASGDSFERRFRPERREMA